MVALLLQQHDLWENSINMTLKWFVILAPNFDSR